MDNLNVAKRCMECGSEFFKQEKYISHVKSHFTSNKVKKTIDKKIKLANNDKKLTCSICDKLFCSPESLKTHGDTCKIETPTIELKNKVLWNVCNEKYVQSHLVSIQNRLKNFANPECKNEQIIAIPYTKEKLKEEEIFEHPQDSALEQLTLNPNTPEVEEEEIVEHSQDSALEQLTLNPNTPEVEEEEIVEYPQEWKFLEPRTLNPNTPEVEEEEDIVKHPHDSALEQLTLNPNTENCILCRAACDRPDHAQINNWCMP